MPVISAVIGYVTNVLAIKMTFYPLEYKGIKPILGWQGIIPSKAGKMAAKAVDLLTRDLFKPKDVFSNLSSDEIVRLTREDFRKMSRSILDSVLDSKMPGSNTLVGKSVRNNVEAELAKVLPEIVDDTLSKVKDDIDTILDLKTLAVDTLKDDKALINKIFLDLGGKQFRFIETSGAWLGFLFGLGQIFTTIYVNHWVMYVLYGIFIGFITNYLAIKLIFEPTEPHKIGPFVLWGLFLKNQRDESFKYADIIASRIVTPENIFYYIFRSPNSVRTREIMACEISKAIDKVVSALPSLLRIALTNQRLQELKSVTLFQLMNELPLHIKNVYPYMESAFDIRNNIGEKMSKLPPKRFIDFLRPAFQEDEWKLVAVGAALGGVAGLLQSFI